MACRDFSKKRLQLPDSPPPEYAESDPVLMMNVMEKEKTAEAIADPVPVLDTAAVCLMHPELVNDRHSVVDLSYPNSYVNDDEDADPWAMPELHDSSIQWSELSAFAKVQRVVVDYVGRSLALVALLYIFICSLDFLSSAFRLIGGKATGEIFNDSEILSNPVTGLMIGVLATVMLQSSSTSTSIVVTMVASGIVDVRRAIPIVMGANIGTSVTNTIVSFAQSQEKNEFRRAFAGATVHDMFNWLSVLILLPMEVATGYLFTLTKAITSSYNLGRQESADREFLTVLTKPFTRLVVQLDKGVIEDIALGVPGATNKSLIKYWCSYETTKSLINATMEQNYTDNSSATLFDYTVEEEVKVGVEPCSFLFHDTGLADEVLGVVLLALSLCMLCSCLVLMVKLLHSMLRGQIATAVKTMVNADFPGPLSHLTGYFAIGVGACMTILVQSSSVFTSALTPLVGIGVVGLERMYPLTLGANIGTTVTGLLAAMASSGARLRSALQIALCHLLFNVSGIALFYPIPVTRRLPIGLAKMLGNTTARYRWFAILYLLAMFVLLPVSVFALTIAGPVALAVVGIPACVVAAFVVVVNVMQAKLPGALPQSLRTWEAFPEWMHSLEPLDRLLARCSCCRRAALQTRTPRPAMTRNDASSRHLLDTSANSSANSSRLPSRNSSHVSLPIRPSLSAINIEQKTAV
ncbi:PREDICTED: sodium-dependent phosphate transport protein 2A-like [Priapulus caudatus]|uniref:Sodium-dependent phosphate transport protein 2A-like n=1 Tax=Priapulus caudatus TaxID=37621 RepID=A0ABM1DTS3_PRICU|nr:PREDICTED: sodium-dependent phosphate transport protein 2A-like [Priapulus caudatus]